MRNDGDSSQMPSGTTTATASGVSSSSSSNLSPTISPRGLGGSNDGDEDGDTPLARYESISMSMSGRLHVRNYGSIDLYLRNSGRIVTAFGNYVL